MRKPIHHAPFQLARPAGDVKDAFGAGKTKDVESDDERAVQVSAPYLVVYRCEAIVPRLDTSAVFRVCHDALIQYKNQFANMRILVSGGRGFLGLHIVSALRREGHNVAILSRSAGADVTVPSTLADVCVGQEVVIHCVQFPNHPVENPRRGWTYMRVDGEGTCNLVAAARAAGVRRFIYISGAGVGPDRTQSWFRAKWMAEEAIRASGISFVIFRPSLVYGPEDRSLNRFIEVARRLPVVPVIGNGQQEIYPVYVDELAALVAKAVTLEAATNRIFDVGGERVMMDGLLQEIGKLLGKHRLLIHIPKGLVKLAARFLQYLPGRPISPGAVDFITMEAGCDNRKTRDVFGWTPGTLKENLRHYAIR